MATSQRRVMWYVFDNYLTHSVFTVPSKVDLVCLFMQWSYGVTMWEIFSGGKGPFPGTDPLTLLQRLEDGDRMPKPSNAACTKEM